MRLVGGQDPPVFLRTIFSTPTQLMIFAAYARITRGASKRESTEDPYFLTKISVILR